MTFLRTGMNRVVQSRTDQNEKQFGAHEGRKRPTNNLNLKDILPESLAT